MEALAVLEREKVDAIISDILMPRMDGYRFCYEVRASERFRHLPFIFYTSSYTSQGDEKLALEMGADKFLTKPAPAGEIIQALHEATTKNGVRFTPAEPARELNLMKEYNQQLVAKLEQKNAELTARNEELIVPSKTWCSRARRWQRPPTRCSSPMPRESFSGSTRPFPTLTGYTVEEVVGQNAAHLQVRPA